MAKSKYPTKIDSSVEIPAARDNILESGSDIINSLRSAIFAIEKTLGIDPQGTSGNTVASRLSQSLDDNGNIKSTALSLSNVLSGPILDNDVSDVAAIKEYKLKLDFPTKILQSELSSLSLQIDQIISNVENLTSEVLSHTNPSSSNRHPATAISIAAYSSAGSQTSSKQIVAGSVNDFAKNIYDGHVNFSGNATSAENSHAAEQIYFDNSASASVVLSSDVQGAIEDIANNQFQGIVSHQNKFHTDGILSVSSETLPGEEWGQLFAEDVIVSFAKNSAQEAAETTITLGSPILLEDFDLKPFDLIKLADTSDVQSAMNGVYQISSLVVSLDNLSLEGVNVFGALPVASNATSVAKIYKKTDVAQNDISLLVCARQNASLTSSNSVQISDGRSAFVVSKKCRPAEITLTNRFIDVKFDDGSAITIDVFDSLSSWQSIDSIVFKINEFCAENYLNFSAYRLDLDTGSEFVIVSNIPDDESETHSITISRSSDDAIDSLGLTYAEDIEKFSKYGTSFTLMGAENLGLKTKIDSSSLVFFAGTNIIQGGGAGIDFLELGVKRDDLIIISDSTSDDGTYVVTNVNATNITVSSAQIPTGFSALSPTGTRFRIYENIVSFKDLEFAEVSDSFGSVLSEIFIDKNRNVHSKIVFEYLSQVYSSNSIIQLVDYNGDISGHTFNLSVVGGTELVTFSLDSGQDVVVRGERSYVWVTSGLKNVRLKFYVKDVAAINSKIISDGDNIAMEFFGFEPVNRFSNLVIAKIPYDNFNGRIVGADYGRSSDKRQIGTISSIDIQQNAKEELSYRPIRELRENGVFSGCNVSEYSVENDLFVFKVESGIVYVAGKRLEISEQEIVTDIDATSYDKAYLAIDEFSNIVFQPALPGCASPFIDSDVCILGTLEFDEINTFFIDMRLFIDHLDLKLLNSITVSPQKGMAHFSSIPAALAYAKRFSGLYPFAGVPTIHLKSGVHEINLDIENAYSSYDDWKDEYDLGTAAVFSPQYEAIMRGGIFVDFPVSIEGEGDSTVLKIRYNNIFGEEEYTNRGSILIPGNGFAYTGLNYDKFNSGKISISNLKMDNCYVDYVDGNCQTTSTLHPCLLQIDNVTFDGTGFTESAIDEEIGPVGVFLREVYDLTNKKGNLSVLNSRLISSNIRFSNGTRVYNLNVSENRIQGEASDVLFVGNSINFFEEPFSQGRNIVIGKNSNDSNFSDTGVEILDGVPWSDFVSRNLVVAGELSANTIVGLDNITAAQFNGDPDLTISAAEIDIVSSSTSTSISDPSMHILSNGYMRIDGEESVRLISKEQMTVGYGTSFTGSPSSRVVLNDDGILIYSGNGNDIVLQPSGGGQIVRSPAIIRYKNIPMHCFPNTVFSGLSINYQNHKYVRYSAGGSATFETHIGVHLPDGVSVFRIELTGESDGPANEVEVQLYEIQIVDGESTEIGEIAQVMPASYGTISANFSDVAIDNASNYYIIRVSGTIDSVGGSLDLYAVRIVFTTVSVGEI